MSEYSFLRNALIDGAEAEANRRAGKKPTDNEFALEEWKNNWNRIFHETMDRMWREYKNSIDPLSLVFLKG